MNDKKRLGINFIAQLFSFGVSFVISFFLTPFILDKLGTEAYGFIGLANNFVSYTTLITIALNSMAGRFITISFHKGDIGSAKKYFASVYYSNLFLAGVIAVFSILTVGFLDSIIHIPVHLEWDVKLLFGLTFLNSIIALTSNVYSVATFVRNRLDLSSIRNIISNLLRVLCIVTPFLIFAPHLWYYGISALVATLFVAITNRTLTKKLLPDFKITSSLFSWGFVKELVFSGGWNLLSKLGEILSTGLDLLLANLLISSVAMGVFSISKVIPIVIISLCGSIAAVFAPKLTEFYAKGQMNILRNELYNNIRIMSVFSALPLMSFLVIGEDFFRLWVPTQDSHVLYTLSAVTIGGLLISMPQESLWNIFTITNKVKISALVQLVFNILAFITIIIGVTYFDNEYYQLLSIVSSRFIWGTIQALIFLPTYGARCLNLKWNTFYYLILKYLFLAAIIITFLFFCKMFFVVDSWISFVLAVLLICFTITIFMSFFILDKAQKKAITSFVNKKIYKNSDRL